MFLAATNKLKRLLTLNYVGHVRPQDLEQDRNEVLALLDDLPEEFRLLTDLSQVQTMDVACESEISRMMEILDKRGLTTVVRVIPQPHQDIGFKILGALHYQRRIRTVTCQSMEEALRILAGGT